MLASVFASVLCAAVSWEWQCCTGWRLHWSGSCQAGQQHIHFLCKYYIYCWEQTRMSQHVSCGLFPRVSLHQQAFPAAITLAYCVTLSQTLSQMPRCTRRVDGLLVGIVQARLDSCSPVRTPNIILHTHTHTSIALGTARGGRRSKVFVCLWRAEATRGVHTRHLAESEGRLSLEHHQGRETCCTMEWVL